MSRAKHKICLTPQSQSCLSEMIDKPISITHNKMGIYGIITLVARFFESWKQKPKQLKAEIYAIYLAYKNPRVPWYARIFAACAVGYAFSPIDLIPDPIPILVYLDDLILVQLGVIIALKMIPTEVLRRMS